MQNKLSYYFNHLLIVANLSTWPSFPRDLLRVEFSILGLQLRGAFWSPRFQLLWRNWLARCTYRHEKCGGCEFEPHQEHDFYRYPFLGSVSTQESEQLVQNLIYLFFCRGTYSPCKYCYQSRFCKIYKCQVSDCMLEFCEKRIFETVIGVREIKLPSLNARRNYKASSAAIATVGGDSRVPFMVFAQALTLWRISWFEQQVFFGIPLASFHSAADSVAHVACVAHNGGHH